MYFGGSNSYQDDNVVILPKGHCCFEDSNGRSFYKKFCAGNRRISLFECIRVNLAV